MKNYSKTELGTMDTIAKSENGKVFLHDALNLTSCEISINSVPAGFKVPFNHKHIQNEEIYIVLSGTGRMTIDGVDEAMRPGTALRIAPQAARTIENTGADNMQFICIQARDGGLNQFGLADAEIC